MAPEQARGRSAEVGPAADVYSLGAVLYECLTGRPPFRGPTPLETLLDVLTRDPAPPRRLRPDVPRDLETICLKCLRKEPGRRYATAEALADDLRRFRENRPVSVRPVGLLERAGLWARRRPAAALAAGLLLLAAVLAAGAGAAIWFWAGAEQARKETKDALGQAQAAQQKAEDAGKALADANGKLADANDRLDQGSYLFKVDLAYRDLLNLDFGRADRLLAECPPERRRWEWGFVHALRRTCVQSFRLPAPEDSPLDSGMTTTPDGARLAVAWDDGAVQVWDLRSGKMEAEWSVKPTKPPPIWRGKKGVVSLAFSPDSKRLAGGPADGTVRVWDAATGKEEQRFPGDLGEFGSPAFSPDGKRLAAALFSGPVKVWDLASGQEEHTLKGDDKDHSFDCVAFSADGKRLAAASFHGLTAWDLESEEPLLHRTEDKDVIVVPEAVSFTADGDGINYVTLDRGVAFIVLRVGKEEPERKVDCGGSRDMNVALAPDGRRLAVLDKDGEVTLWDLAPGHEAVVARWTSDTATRYSGYLGFSADGGRLIDVCTSDLRVWDTGTPYPQRRLFGKATPISGVVVSRDGRRLAAGGDFGVRAWDAADGRFWSIDTSAQKPGVFNPHPYGRPLAFSPDGRRVACPDAEALRVWDLDAGQEERALDVGGKDVTAVAWAADGRLAALTEDGVVRVWGEAEKPERTWTCEEGKSSESRLSADGSVLLAGYGPQALWDVREGRRIQSLNGSGGSFGNTAVSADGRRAAASSVDLETRAVRVAVWDRDKAEPIFTADVGDANPAPKNKLITANAFALSPDGRRLAVALKNGTVQLWDVDAGREALVTRQRGSELTALAFSGDGRTLAGVEVGGEVRLFTTAADAP
jgi:WD40 repeat protein